MTLSNSKVAREGLGVDDRGHAGRPFVFVQVLDEHTVRYEVQASALVEAVPTDPAAELARVVELGGIDELRDRALASVVVELEARADLLAIEVDPCAGEAGPLTQELAFALGPRPREHRAERDVADEQLESLVGSLVVVSSPRSSRLRPPEVKVTTRPSRPAALWQAMARRRRASRRGSPLPVS